MIKRLQAIRKRGFNLIEAAIVLAVVGAVIGGIWTAASSMIRNHKISETIHGLQFIIENTRKLISRADCAQLGEAFILTPSLLAANAFPENWVEGSNVKNPFGGSVVVHNSYRPDLERIGFGIYLTNIDPSICEELAARISSLGAIAGNRKNASFTRNNYVSQIAIKNQTGGSETWIYFYNFPLSLGDANVKSACNQGAKAVLMTAHDYTRNNN